MSLEEKYPDLFQFLAGYFPEADLDGLYDEAVVASFTKENPEDIILQTRQELDALMNDEALWNEASYEANRYFESQDQLLSWLKMIQQTLAKEDLP